MTELKMTCYGVTANIRCDRPTFLNLLESDFHLLMDNSVAQSEFHIDVSFSKGRAPTWFFFKGSFLGLGVTSDFSFISGNQDIEIRQSQDRYLVRAAETEKASEALRLILYSEWIWRIGKLHGWLPLHAMAYKADGLSHLVLGRTCAGKSNLAKNIVLQTEYQLLGDELIWYDGKQLYPFCTSIRYRTSGLPSKSTLQVEKVRVGSASVLASVENLSAPIKVISFWDSIDNFVIFLSGEGLPQMLVFNLHPRRLFGAMWTVLKRIRLALRLTMFVHGQKRIKRVASLLPSAISLSEQ
jgi:hypothetical protein